MSCVHSKFYKKYLSHSGSFKDLVKGVEMAKLSSMLPKEVRLLICHMSIGFPMYCKGVQEAHSKNRRDMKCLVMRFVSEPPKNGDWTCWPCLDFLKKFNRQVFRKRAVLSSVCLNHMRRPQCVRNTARIKKKTVQRHLREEFKNPVVIKLRYGEILISGEINNVTPFYAESFGTGSNGSTAVPSSPRSLFEVKETSTASNPEKD